MDAIKTLEDVLAKTVKNTSRKNRERAVDALRILFAENSNHQQVTEYLIKLHYSVCQAFFEEFSSSATDSDTFALAEGLVNDEQFRKGNPNNIMYPKGLSAVLALASKGKYQASFLILIRILSQSVKSKGFADGCLNNFKKLIVDKNGMHHILNIYEQATKGDVACEEFELKRFDKFLKALDNRGVIIIHEETAVVEVPSYQVATPVSVTSSSTSAPASPEQPKVMAQSGDDTAFARLDATQQEILAAVRKLSENRSSIDSLSLSISRRDEEIAAAKANLAHKKQRVLSLENEIVMKERRLAEISEQVADLTERLRTSLQMDDISKSQELITLKNDISEALKLDYTDFIKSRENPYGEDLFDAYRSTLARIFKLLKRFGISCQ